MVSYCSVVHRLTREPVEDRTLVTLCFGRKINGQLHLTLELRAGGRDGTNNTTISTPEISMRNLTIKGVTHCL